MFLLTKIYQRIRIRTARIYEVAQQQVKEDCGTSFFINKIKRRKGVVSRVYNFSAGPAVLPEEVLKEAAEEMQDYRGCGMSVMEMSHRSKMFENIIQKPRLT